MGGICGEIGSLELFIRAFELETDLTQSVAVCGDRLGLQSFRLKGSGRFCRHDAGDVFRWRQLQYLSGVFVEDFVYRGQGKGGR